MQSWTFSVKQKEEEHVLNQSVLLNYLTTPIFFLGKIWHQGKQLYWPYIKIQFPLCHIWRNNIRAIRKKGEK